MARGFTIIELLVAVTIFVVVIAIASGTFVNALRTQRAIAALMAANDNAGLSLEQMGREIRTGREFRTNNQSDRLEFVNARGQSAAYELRQGAIVRNQQPITADTVRVTYLLFTLLGETPEDGRSTRVTINLGVGARLRQVEEFITNLQTTVAVRLLDA